MLPAPITIHSAAPGNASKNTDTGKLNEAFVLREKVAGDLFNIASSE